MFLLGRTLIVKKGSCVINEVCEQSENLSGIYKFVLRNNLQEFLMVR